jgi:HD-GYP domain-containing protein (c-di-GMP phosphodiesterase class II)
MSQAVGTADRTGESVLFPVETYEVGDGSGDIQLFPVRVASLRTGTVPNFDLYLLSGPERNPVLYRRGDLPVTVEDLQRLESNRIEMLYVDSRQEVEYRHYLEANIRSILSDEALPISEKSDILYTSVQGMVVELMAEPEFGQGVRRCRDLVESSIQFLYGENSAFSSLLKIAAHDYSIYTHSVNVFVYCMALAKRLRLGDRAQLNQLGIGVLFRDIGLCELEDIVPETASKLTPRQQEAYEQHPLNSHRILRGHAGVGEIALDVARHHHERLDGSGYPDGFRSLQVSEYVRVVAIADEFDELTTKRPDREALNSFPALKAMGEQVHGGLDQSYVRAFIGLMGNPEG